jgi:hypothetical protein
VRKIKAQGSKSKEYEVKNFVPCALRCFMCYTFTGEINTMPKRKRSKKSSSANKKWGGAFKEILPLYAKLADFKKEITKVKEDGERTDDRLTSMEVHVNILARLLTTLCIEKLGIRLGVLRRLVRRVEKEAVRDSQIMELESLYKLSHGNLKKSSSANIKPKDDPWEQIS